MNKTSKSESFFNPLCFSLVPRLLPVSLDIFFYLCKTKEIEETETEGRFGERREVSEKERGKDGERVARNEQRNERE